MHGKYSKLGRVVERERRNMSFILFFIFYFGGEEKEIS